MAFGDDDLRMMCTDIFSDPVVYGARTTYGLFTESESPSDWGAFIRAPQLLRTEGVDQVERSTSVVVPTADLEAGGALVGLREDDPITVVGRAFLVRAFGPTEDGRLTRIRLAEAEG